MRHVRDEGVAGSNPATPTKFPDLNQWLIEAASAALKNRAQKWAQKRLFVIC